LSVEDGPDVFIISFSGDEVDCTDDNEVVGDIV
jgi:hypothetical protein